MPSTEPFFLPSEESEQLLDEPLAECVPCDKTYSHVRQVAIARFQNGIESGYFAAELMRETQVEIGIQSRERFDARLCGMVGGLPAGFPKANRTTQSLRALIATSNTVDSNSATYEPAASNVPSGVWVPMVVTLDAGSIACFRIERFASGATGSRRPRLAEPLELCHVLQSARGTWLQRPESDRGIRELTFDPDAKTVRLCVDADGDGDFERHQDFVWKPW